MDNIVFSLNNFEYFLLILVRIASFIFIAPIFGQNGIPRQIKIGLSFFISISFLLLQSYAPLVKATSVMACKCTHIFPYGKHLRSFFVATFAILKDKRMREVSHPLVLVKPC